LRVRRPPERTVVPRRFVYPTRSLTPQEIMIYRSFGEIPHKKREGTVTVNVKVDPTTYKMLLNEQKRLNRGTSKFSLSDTVRFLILKGLEYCCADQKITVIVTPETFQTLKEKLEKFNENESLNFSLNDFALFLMEKGLESFDQKT